MDITVILSSLCDYFTNVKWIIIGENKLTAVFYTEQHGCMYKEFDLINHRGIRIDVSELYSYCRNIDTVVSCRRSSYFADDFAALRKRIAEYEMRYRQYYPRLRAMVSTSLLYNTLRYHILSGLVKNTADLSEYIKNTFQSNGDIFVTVELYDKPVCGWYSDTTRYAGRFTEAPNVIAMQKEYSKEEHMVCSTLHDGSRIARETVMCPMYDNGGVLCVENDSAVQKQKQEKSTLAVLRHRCTQYLYTSLKPHLMHFHSVHKFVVDDCGRLYINDELCNFKIPYGVMETADDQAWEIIVGMPREKFNKGLEYQANGAAYYFNALQEQHIPRWGLLFDFHVLPDFTRLTHINIARMDVALRMREELAVMWEDFYKYFGRLRDGALVINGIHIIKGVVSNPTALVAVERAVHIRDMLTGCLPTV